MGIPSARVTTKILCLRAASLWQVSCKNKHIGRSGMTVRSLLGLVSLALALPAYAAAPAHPKYDYPTAARADYVIGCLGSNGFNRIFLDKCSCEIDTIANYMPYNDYEK